MSKSPIIKICRFSTNKSALNYLDYAFGGRLLQKVCSVLFLFFPSPLLITGCVPQTQELPWIVTDEDPVFRC